MLGRPPRPRSVQVSVRHVVCAVIVALLALLVGAGGASAATDHVVITGGADVPAGRAVGGVGWVDGEGRVARPATGDVLSGRGPLRLNRRVGGDPRARCRQ